ncbi:MAG: dihydroorotate dehydrogenase (NAD+) catalytic subunit [Planctomycetaceae bacterium]|jgi:dihydroorotate dehydrogenase (NAD+) catalytic subunit
MTVGTSHPRYDPTQTYRWNYENAPEPVDVEVPTFGQDWTFCGRKVPSPLGIPAGPLLNGKWVLYYASLGFDVLTYKTVRSSQRDCYPLPNLVSVETGQLTGGEQRLAESASASGSWAVSFGMPSADPDLWRRDVEETRNRLAGGKLLSISVVGTVQPGWSIDDLAADYALCAKWAVDAGADTIETNFSCPNVETCDGQLYQNPAEAAQVAEAVRQTIGDRPLILKIGHTTAAADAEELLKSVGPFATAIAMTNSVATTIEGKDGKLLFDGQQRGICGEATFDASLQQTRLFSDLIHKRGDDVRIISVGGVSTGSHVRSCLQAGAESVHIATAAMLDPTVAVKIRRDWQS